MNKFIFSITLSLITLSSHAVSEISFHENDAVELVLSQSNYNRVLVDGDEIKKASCPQEYLAIEYAKDGSAILNVLQPMPFTVFFETKSGHHFSANIQSEESLGKTVTFKPMQVLVKREKYVKPKQSQKMPTNELVLNLIQAMSRDEAIQGFTSKRNFGSYQALNNSIRFKVSKRMIGKSLEGEVVEIYNRSSLPVILQEAWFSDSNTKGLAISKPILNPGESERVYRVLEVSHA